MSGSRLSAIASCAWLPLLGGCFAHGSTLDEPIVPLTQPTELCSDAGKPGCRSPREVEGWLSRGDLEILHSTDAPHGKQDARVLTVALDGRRIVFRAKWRAMSTAHQLNVPRRELGAHAVQKLFLDPEDWVVPPAAGHCFELDGYRKVVDRAAEASFDDTACVFGFLSYWLEDVRGVEDAADEGWIESEELRDAERFRSDPVYRRSLANVNLLSHVIDHGDTHPKQFVLSQSGNHLRLFLVDNTIAFSEFRNPSIDHEWDWSVLHVNAVPMRTVKRLEALRKKDVMALTVIEEYTSHDGVLVQQAGPTVARVGLTENEAARVWQRISGVLSRVRAGKLGVF